jgi:hypothetical protein
MDKTKMLKMLLPDTKTPEQVAHREEARLFYVFVIQNKIPDGFGKIDLATLVSFLENNKQTNFAKSAALELDLTATLAEKIEETIKMAQYMV